tara:strand:+ start:1926 stop:3902 length:1977 start_codon:yes stop_codon:yes gene_type:complete
MKLSEYLPQVPQMQQTMADLNKQISLLDVMKSTGETGAAPTVGLDHVVNTWVRHQMAYRQQLVQDLQTITLSVEEIRGPLNHITGEVFRRGIEIVPNKENPDTDQRKRLMKWLKDCNVFDQSMEEVFRQFHFDVNSLDDAFLYMAKEYKDVGDGEVRSKLLEIRRLNPALVEFDLDQAGLPKNSHFICPIHREVVQEAAGKCERETCNVTLHPAMYKYYHRSQHMYFTDAEIIHLSKFAPSETYGWSPILTIFEKALTLVGMDKNLYRYFFERKMPASMLMVTTDDPESLRKEREHIAAQTRMDPNYIPMVAVSARNQRGRVDMVRLFHTLQEMDYLPVRDEIRERVAAMWGVTPAWQGAPEAFGGMSTQTQQLVVMSRVVEGDQRLFHEKIFPQLLDAFGITDYDLKLPQPEEKAENTRLSFAQQKIQIVNQFAQLGFDVKLKEQDVDLYEAEFVVSGEAVQTAQIAEEQQKIALQQTKDQQDLVKKQTEIQEDQLDQQEQQMEMQEVDLNADGEVSPEEALAIQAMQKSIPASQRKFKGRTGGVTPNWADKHPDEERDIDEYAEARANKNELTLSKTWIESLNEKGFGAPVIKQVSDDLSQMWFSENNVDYIAQLSATGVTTVEKAIFGDPTRFSRYKQEGPKATKPTDIEDIEDE